MSEQEKRREKQPKGSETAKPAGGAVLPRERRLRLLDYVIAFIILAAVPAGSLHTIRSIGPSWDEPVYFREVKNYAAWFKSLGQGQAFSRAGRESAFTLGLETDVSPSLAKLLAAGTYVSLKNYLGEFRAYRFYAPILFGFLLVLVYLRAGAAWGRMAGIAAVCCALFMPRLFTHGHIGATETPLCFFWFLTALIFEASLKRRWLMPLAGISCGLAMSVKFSGFVLPIPLLAWALSYHRKKVFQPRLFFFLLGPLVFILLNPPIWDHPVRGLLEFIKFSAFRRGEFLIPLLFLGKYYEYSGPFYYAPFMVLVTAPVITLLLFLLGIARAAANRFQDQLAGAALIHFCFFVLMMMAPNAPNYDGVRLFLPAFVFLALLAGFGFGKIADWLAAKVRVGPGLVKAGLVVALTMLSAYPLARVYPFGLEYYNELIGGVAGARRHGMETTYWWTAVNPEALARINQALPPGSSLVCWPVRAKICEFDQEMGWLRKDLRISDQTDFDHLLMLSRPYAEFEPFFASMGMRRSELEIVAQQDLDGVPLWVLYKNPHPRY